MNTFLESVCGATQYSSPWRAAPVTTGVVPSPDFDTKWRAVMDRLLDARNLAADWDGQGAVAPPHCAVDRALKLASTLKSRDWPAPTDSGPTVDGSVTLTWHAGKQSVVIEVTSTLEVEAHRWTEGDARAERFFL